MFICIQTNLGKNLSLCVKENISKYWYLDQIYFFSVVARSNDWRETKVCHVFKTILAHWQNKHRKTVKEHGPWRKRFAGRSSTWHGNSSTMQLLRERSCRHAKQATTAATASSTPTTTRGGWRKSEESKQHHPSLVTNPGSKLLFFCVGGVFLLDQRHPRIH